MRLGDVVRINSDVYSESEGVQTIQYLDTGNITENKIDELQTLIVGKDKIPSRARRHIRQNSIVYSTVRPIQRHFGIIKDAPRNLLVSTGFAVIDALENVADAEYIYFFLSQDEIIERLQALAEQGVSTYPSIKPSAIAELEIKLPPLAIQKKISSILCAIRDRIEANRRINDNLEQQALALYKAWFVDFSVFGGIVPTDWQNYHLVDFLPVITGKKNANVSSVNGKYPFFSCSQNFAWTDDYSFDGSAILVAGNGDFNVKFYGGKFEAYQRTYVLMPYEPQFTAWLYYAVKYHLSSIISAARGSVIKFITKGSLENFEFVAPKVPASLPIIHTLDAINKKIATNCKENIKLETMRETLLPRLMSGEIDVSDVEI